MSESKVLVHPEGLQSVVVDEQEGSPSQWQPIATAPQDGTRVRVGHEASPESMKIESRFVDTGTFEDGYWVCSAAFVCTDMRLRWQPTHWMPLP